MIPYWQLYVGLVLGVVANVVVQTVVGLNPANLTAIVVCAGAIVFIRVQEKSRGEG